MKSYETFVLEDFVMDEKFRSWVLNPNTELNLDWDNWLSQNTDKQIVVSQARELVLAIHQSYDEKISDQLVNQQIQEITRLAERSKTSENSLAKYLLRYPVWHIAAMLCLTAGLSWLFFTRKVNQEHSVGEKTEERTGAKMLVTTNNTNQELTVLLSDNSVATLMKGSSLSYPSKFEDNERKVSLSGEAFFDIAKDPDKPFLVYANETVTKVLGTSFRVKAFEKENTVMVLVKTGKVSVYPEQEYKTLINKDDGKVTGVVLNPNQQAVFIRDQHRMEKGIVENSQMLNELVTPKELIFDEKPVLNVFEAFEDIYGIEIVYDKETMKDCIVNAQFKEENLKERMNAICQAIGATYEMVGGQIIINSKGCNPN